MSEIINGLLERLEQSVEIDERLSSVQETLRKHSQTHLLQFYDRLKINEKLQLIQQIETIDFKDIETLFKQTQNNS